MGIGIGTAAMAFFHHPTIIPICGVALGLSTTVLAIKVLSQMGVETLDLSKTKIYRIFHQHRLIRVITLVYSLAIAGINPAAAFSTAVILGMFLGIEFGEAAIKRKSQEWNTFDGIKQILCLS